MPNAVGTLTFNGEDLGDGTDFSLVKIDGLQDMPDLRTSDRTRLLRHGMLPGQDLLGGRSIVVEFEGDAGADSEAQLATFTADLDALRLASRPGQDEKTLTFEIPGVAGGGTRRVSARLRRFAGTIDERYFHGLPVMLVEFFSTDPLIYDDTESSYNTTLPTSGGGLEFPLVFPLVFGDVSEGGTIHAINEGTFETPPLLTITGPCTNPEIENVTTGDTLSFDIVLGDGETLEIDVNSRTVMLNGTASRYNTLVDAEWFDLVPGDNEIDFRAFTGTSATLDVVFRSAWW